MERTGGRDKLLSDNRKKNSFKIEKKITGRNWLYYVTKKRIQLVMILKHSHTFFAFVPH